MRSSAKLCLRGFFPDDDPIGKALLFGSKDRREIVGIVSDVKLFGLNLDARPMMYSDRAGAGGGVMALARVSPEVGLPLSGPGYVIEYPLLERAAADGVDVLIDGQGGDEVFGPALYLLSDLVSRMRFVASIQTARRYPGARNVAPWNRSLLGFGCATGSEARTPPRASSDSPSTLP